MRLTRFVIKPQRTTSTYCTLPRQIHSEEINRKRRHKTTRCLISIKLKGFHVTVQSEGAGHIRCAGLIKPKELRYTLLGDTVKVQPLGFRATFQGMQSQIFKMGFPKTEHAVLAVYKYILHIVKRNFCHTFHKSQVPGARYSTGNCYGEVLFPAEHSCLRCIIPSSLGNAQILLLTTLV